MMAQDPRKKAQREAAAAEKLKHSLQYRDGYWYDSNGNVRGRGPSEDSPMVPVKTTGDEPIRRPTLGPTGQVVRQSYRDTGTPPTTAPSSTEPTPTSPTAPATPATKGGQYTGADLAAAVKVDPALTKLAAGAPINDVEMEKILATRISGKKEKTLTVGDDAWDRARDLAEVIIDALPPELHNADVATALDFRPYLKQLDGKKIVFRSSTGMLLPDITKAKTVHTDVWVKRENERLAGNAVVASAGVTPPADTSFNTGTAGVVPVDPAAAGTSGITVGPNGEIVLPNSQQQDTRFPIEGLRAAVQSGSMTLEQLAQQESANIDAGGTGYFPVDVGKATTPMPGVPAASTDTVGITDALKYLYDVPPTEVHNLQLKMAAAGYFDKLDNGGTYIDGDPTDANTQAAWKMLLTDSITTKRSVPAVLGGGLRDYREQVRKSRMSQLQAVDPSYVSAVANDFGQSMFGRDLTPAELQQMINHVKTLRFDRAGYVAGVPGNTGDGPPSDRQGYSSDDIKLALEASPGVKEQQRDNNRNALAFKLKGLLH